MKIKVIGPGCRNCMTLYKTTKNIIDEISGSFDLEHVTDISKMVTYGVRRSPGLMINGRVVSEGKRLNDQEVRAIIEEYL